MPHPHRPLDGETDWSLWLLILNVRTWMREILLDWMQKSVVSLSSPYWSAQLILIWLNWFTYQGYSCLMYLQTLMHHEIYLNTSTMPFNSSYPCSCCLHKWFPYVWLLNVALQLQKFQRFWRRLLLRTTHSDMAFTKCSGNNICNTSKMDAKRSSSGLEDVLRGVVFNESFGPRYKAPMVLDSLSTTAMVS